MSVVPAKHQMNLHSVARALTNFKKVGKNNYSAALIRSRIATLKDNWTLCGEGHAALLTAFPPDKRKDIPYFEDLEFERHEDHFQEALDYMTECLEELEPLPLNSTPLASHSSRCCSTVDRSLSHLPPINIPPFSGKAEDWESFRDRFTSLIINNKDVSAFARMHFLSSSLSGRALEAIKTVPFTADNFHIAWQILVSRYDNKRRLIDVHVSALCNLPSVPRESALELTELRDKANRAIASLQGLNRTSDDILSDILSSLVVQKLDYATRKAWRLKSSDDNHIPSYDDLDRFLAARARALEELTPHNPAKSSRPANGRSSSVNAATASPVSCPICRASHFINKCPKFIQASSHQRMELVRQNKRCINCLSSKHDLAACPSKFSCRTCQQKHHSTLHVDLSSPATATTALATVANATAASASTSSTPS
ncbi:uncharacterized protein LOC120357109 [Solenopsis invicta]|uniref:uncharacterized protein LOC120357109 n=1 Tax=Solenopsis invicta TaxID=13686 RepID=UPI00193C8AFC|nr:uncharacterized protein LOC120357109 [Solenopsis invicta]